MAGGKVYHAEDGIISLAMAGRDLTVDEFFAHLPPQATLLALPPNYPAPWTNLRIQRVLPQFRRPVKIDDLPGWSVFERDSRCPRAIIHSCSVRSVFGEPPE